MLAMIGPMALTHGICRQGDVSEGRNGCNVAYGVYLRPFSIGYRSMLLVNDAVYFDLQSACQLTFWLDSDG